MRTLSCGMHVGSSSPTRDRIQAPCIGSAESYPLCHQESPHICLYFILKIFYLFNFFGLRLVFIAACGLSLVAASGGYSSLQCTGFSMRWLLLLRSMGSRRVGFSSCGSWPLERRLSSVTRGLSCSAAWGIFPGPGLQPVSPALAGGFLTTAPHICL